MSTPNEQRPSRVFAQTPILAPDQQAIIDKLRAGGFVVQPYAADAEHPGYAHTGGLCLHGLPELVIIGAPNLLDSAKCLGTLARNALKGTAELKHGARYGGLLPGRTVHLHETRYSASAEWCDVAAFAASYFRRWGGRPELPDDIPVLQVLWSDAQGRMPWNEQFDMLEKPRQPMLF